MPDYDIIIIGSGLGGLVCGAVLSMNGYKVCILEKNRQLGGCLQTFSRDKAILDTGVHYVGGLAEGQQLHQVFRYLGIIEKLKLKRLDMEAFDEIGFSGDPETYKLAQGYDRFMATLLKDFPGEEAALRTYCDKIREVCSKFPLYNLRMGDYREKEDVLHLPASGFIESLNASKRLQQVLAGNNLLYAGAADKTPFYIHALITNSFIESAWKCVDGGSQIAKYLGRVITGQGGTILRNRKVCTIVADTGVAEYVVLEDGTRVSAKYVISNLHPAQTIEMTQSDVFRIAYRNRIRKLENSPGPFLLNVVLKKDSFRYLNHNYYHHETDNVWGGADYDAENWPLTYAVFVNASSRNDTYADSLTIMTYMRYEDVACWENTCNTDSHKEDRGADYEAFKLSKSERLLDKVAERFPSMRDCIQSYYAATPLSYRDYQGTSDGSMYGITKDYHNPFSTFIAPKTKIPNLYLTGQNLNLHGILGVTISALMTCGELLDIERLLEEINMA